LSRLAAWLCAALSIPQDLYQQNLLDDFDLSAPSRHFTTLIKKLFFEANHKKVLSLK